MESAVIYTRSATTNELSIAAQEKACRDYAQTQGLNAVQVFSDNGYSGMRLDRPALQAALDYINEHRIPFLVVQSTDRLARTISPLLELYAGIAARGAEIVVVKEQSAEGLQRLVQLAADATHHFYFRRETSVHLVDKTAVRSIFFTVKNFEHENLVRRLHVGRKLARERRAAK